MNYKKVGRNERSNLTEWDSNTSTFKLLVLSGEVTAGSAGH